MLTLETAILDCISCWKQQQQRQQQQQHLYSPSTHADADKVKKK